MRFVLLSVKKKKNKLKLFIDFKIWGILSNNLKKIRETRKSGPSSSNYDLEADLLGSPVSLSLYHALLSSTPKPLSVGSSETKIASQCSARFPAPPPKALSLIYGSCLAAVRIYLCDHCFDIDKGRKTIPS